jgi:hypothetical protein
MPDIKELYDKLQQNPTISLPDFNTFSQKYGSEQGFSDLYNKMKVNPTIDVPDFDTFKGKYFSAPVSPAAPKSLVETFTNILGPPPSVDPSNLLNGQGFMDAVRAREKAAGFDPDTPTPPAEEEPQYTAKDPKDQTTFDIIYHPLTADEAKNLKPEDQTKTVQSGKQARQISPYDAILKSILVKNRVDEGVLQNDDNIALQEHITQQYQEAVKDLTNISQKNPDGSYTYSKEQASAIAAPHLKPFIERSIVIDKKIQGIQKELDQLNPSWYNYITFDNLDPEHSEEADRVKLTKELTTLRNEYNENEANKVALQRAFVNQGIKSRNPVADLIAQNSDQVLNMPANQLLPMLTQQGVWEEGFGYPEYLRADQRLKTANTTGEDILSPGYLDRHVIDISTNPQYGSWFAKEHGLVGTSQANANKTTDFDKSIVQIQKQTSQGLASTLEYTGQLLDAEYKQLQTADNKYKPQIEPVKQSLDAVAKELEADPRNLAIGQRYEALRQKYNGLIDQANQESGTLRDVYNKHLEVYKKLTNIDKTQFGDLKRFDYEKAQMAKYGKFDHWYEAILPDAAAAISESIGNKLLDAPLGISDLYAERKAHPLGFIGDITGLNSKLGIISPDEELSVLIGNQELREWDYRYLQPDIFKNTQMFDAKHWDTTKPFKENLSNSVNWRVAWHNAITGSVGSLLLAAPMFAVPEEEVLSEAVDGILGGSSLFGDITGSLLSRAGIARGGQEGLGHTVAPWLHKVLGAGAIGIGTAVHMTPEEVEQGLALWRQGKLDPNSIMGRAFLNEMEVNITEAAAFSSIYRPNPEGILKDVLAKKTIGSAAEDLGIKGLEELASKPGFWKRTGTSTRAGLAMGAESAYGVAQKGVAENGIRDVIDWYYTKQNERYGKHDKLDESGNPVLDAQGNPVQEDNEAAFTLKNNLETVANTVTSMLPIFLWHGFKHGWDMRAGRYSSAAVAEFEAARHPEAYVGYALDYINTNKNLQKVFPDSPDKEALLKEVQARYKALSDDYKEVVPTLVNLDSDNAKIRYFNSYRAVRAFNSYLAIPNTPALSEEAEKIYDEHVKTLEDLDKQAFSNQRLRTFAPFEFANQQLQKSFLPHINDLIQSEHPSDKMELADTIPFLENNITKWAKVPGYEGTVDLLKQTLDQVKSKVAANQTTAEDQATIDKQEGEANTKNRSIPLKTPRGTVTELKFDTPYLVNSINYVSPKGNKVITIPTITVLSDNHNGTVTIVSDGEVSTIDKKELEKYSYLPQSQLQEWRDKKDIRATILDNLNGIFTYTFGKETKDRPRSPKGRIRWDAKTNKAFFVYRDNKGQIRQYEISYDDIKKKMAKVGDVSNPDSPEMNRQFQEEVAKVDPRQTLQKTIRQAAFDAFLQSEAKKATKAHDAILKGINKTIKNVQNEIKALDILLKNKYKSGGIEALKDALKKALPHQYPVSLMEALDEKLPFQIILAATQHLANLKASLAPYEALINRTEQERAQALNQLGLDYEEIIGKDYASDVSLTDQLTEYREALAEQYKESDSLLHSLKQKINDVKSLIDSLLSNWFNAFSPRIFQGGTMVEANDGTLKEAQEQLTEYQNQANALEKSLEPLAEQITKLDKVIKSISKMENEHNQRVKGLKIQEAQDRIFGSQLKTQTSSETKSPEDTGSAVATALGKIGGVENARISIFNIFNSTTARMDLNPDGTIQDPTIARFQTFCNTVQNPTAFQLLVITKDNAAKYGLSDLIFTRKNEAGEDEPDSNDIRLIVVQQDGGKTYFIDQSGNRLADDQVSADTVIATAMRDARLNWKNGETNYSFPDIYEEEDIKNLAEQLRENHEKRREALKTQAKNGAEIVLPIQGISRGFKNKYLTGEPVSPVGTILNVSFDDLSKHEYIKLPKGPDSGEVTFEGLRVGVKVPSGTPMISNGQTLEHGLNRRFTQQDADNIIDVFRALYQSALKNNGTLDPVLLKYISKLLYFRVPERSSLATGLPQDPSKIGRNQIWISKEDGRLHFGNQNASTPFNFEPNANLTDLEAFILGAYHNIDSTNLLDPFTEIAKFSKTSPVFIQWPSYQAYLLSNVYPDGTPRPSDRIPIKTAIQASQPGAPNMVGRYMTYQDPMKTNEAIVSTFIDRVVITPNAKVGPVTESTVITVPTGEGIQVKVTSIKDLPKGKTYKWLPDSTKPDTVLFKIDADGKLTALSGYGGKSIGQTTAILDKSKDLELLDPKFYEVPDKPEEKVILPKEKPVETPSTAVSFAALMADLKEDDTEMKNLPTVETPKDVDQSAAKKVWGDATDEAPFRQAFKLNYRLENLEKMKSYLESKYPNLPVEIIEGLIEGKGWGQLKDGVIRLSTLAEEGTGFHEEFEYVSKYFLTPKQLTAIRKEFRNRADGFISHETGKYVKYSEATDHQVREQLAEEFRDYMLTDGKTVYTGEVARNSFFRRMWEAMKGIMEHLFGKSDSIHDIFKNIRNAKYGDKRPDLENVDLNPALRVDQVKQNHVIFFHDIMRTMTSFMFDNLGKNGVSIPDFLSSNPDFTSLYEGIKKDIDDWYGGPEVAKLVNSLSRSAFINAFSSTEKLQELRKLLGTKVNYSLGRMVAEKGLNTTETLSKIYDVLNNYAYLSEHYRDFIEEHKDYLGIYGLEFSDDDALLPEDEEDQNYSEYTSNHLTRNAADNANREVKLLLATLTERTYEIVGGDAYGFGSKILAVPRLNSLLMGQVVDYGKVINKLLYKMTDVTTFDEMVTALRELYTADPSYRPIFEKLKLGIAPDEPTVPADQLSEYDRDLRDKFYRSLVMMPVEYHKNILDPQTLTSANVNLNKYRDTSAIIDQWLANIKLGSGLVVIKKGEPTIDVTKLGVGQVKEESEALKFLTSIGIDMPKNLNVFTSAERVELMNAARALYKIFFTDNPNRILTENQLTREPLNTLAKLYINKTDYFKQSQHRSIEGENVQNLILHNSVGLVVKAFNAAKTLDEFYTVYPMMNPENPGNGILQNSQILKKGGRFVDVQGNIINKINIKVLDGAQLKDEQLGTHSSHLALVDRIGYEFANNLEGLYHVFVPGDTKTEWGLEFGTFFTELQASDDTHVLSVMKDYLAAEIAAVQDYLNGVTSGVRQLNAHSEKKKKLGTQLRYFKDILRSVDPDYTLKITVGASPAQIIAKNQEDIDKAILKYLENRAQEVFENFESERLIVPYKEEQIVDGDHASVDTDLLNIAFISKEASKGGFTKDRLLNLIKTNELNYISAVVEQSKLIWGDPAMWKDMPKRTKSFTSGRTLSIANAPYFNEWHNTHSNIAGMQATEEGLRPITLDKGDFGYWEYDDKIRTQTMADVVVVSDQYNAIKKAIQDEITQSLFKKPYYIEDKVNPEISKEDLKKINDALEIRDISSYEKMDEADAQAWSPFTGYREIRQRATTWGKAEEEQYQWDMALARWELTNGKDYETGEVLKTTRNLYPEGPRGEALRLSDEAILAKGNPFLHRYQNNLELPTLNVLKPLQAGPRDGSFLVNNLDKMSIAPITWRLAKSRNMEDWYITHTLARTSYVKVASANKVGTDENIPSFYKDGRPNLDVAHYTLNFNSFGIQVETISQKDASTTGTQLTKQAPFNLMSNGVPTDFKGTDEEWDNLSREEKLKNNNYRLAHENNRILGFMKTLGKMELFKEFGITPSSDADGKPVYAFTDLSRFESLIQRELGNRMAPENIKSAAKLVTTIDEDGVEYQRFALPFDLIIGGEKLESILTSAFDKAVLRPKIHGGQLPQISSAMFESNQRQAVYKSGYKWEPVKSLENLTTEERATVRLTSNDLKFYEMSKDGKKIEACEVLVPFYFKGLIKKGQILSEKDVPLELREGIGFRIPTQGLNSVENFVIKGFLPVEYGNSIVVPSEIVAKSGSDFDIDKLNVYLPNYELDAEGKLQKVKFLDDTNSTLEERYDRHNPFYSFLKSNAGAKWFKEQVAEAVGTKLLNMSTAGEIVPEDWSQKIDTTLSREQNLERLRLDMSDFSRLPIELQNSMEALENKYIDNLREIMSLPENFTQIVEPNSAKILKDQADDINRLYQKESTAKSLTNYIDRLKNAKMRRDFLLGKGGVGVGAGSQSQHAAFQLVGLPLTVPEKLFKFPANMTQNPDGTFTYQLASKYTVGGQTISSGISAFISALVDVNKDPFIIDLNGNQATLGPYMAAARFGIDPEIYTRWITQPIIKEYVNQLERSKSIIGKASMGKQYKSQIIMKAINTFLPKNVQLPDAKQVMEEVKGRHPEDYTKTELDSFIKEAAKKSRGEIDKYSASFMAGQIDILRQYLILEGYQWDLFHLGQAMLDTKRSVTFDSIRLQKVAIAKALGGPFAKSLIKLYENTFQGNILVAKLQFLDAIKPLYITERDAAREVLDPMLNNIFTMPGSADMKLGIAKDVRKAFITYLLHTVPLSVNGSERTLLTDHIKDLLVNADGITKQIRKAQEEQQKADEPNFFLRNLVADRQGLNTLRPIRKSSDKVTMDLSTADFRNLQSLYDDLVTNLIRTSLLQSGVQVTPKSFYEVLPNELFAPLADQILDFLDNPTSDIRAALRNFSNAYYENNWYNPDIVPKAERFSKGGTDRLTNMNLEFGGHEYKIPVFKFFVEDTLNPDYNQSRQANAPYILHYGVKKNPQTGKPLFSKLQTDFMASQGNFDFLERTLYKRLEINRPDGQKDAAIVSTPYFHNGQNGERRYVLFYPVDKKGDRYNSVEYYSRAHRSAVHPEALELNIDGHPLEGRHIMKLVPSFFSVPGLFLNQHYTEATKLKDFSVPLSLITDEDQYDSMLDPDPLVQPLVRHLQLFENKMGEAKSQAPAIEKSLEKDKEDPLKC